MGDAVAEATKAAGDPLFAKSVTTFYQSADAKAAKSGVSAWAAVGGARQDLRMNLQLLAASSPAVYGTMRSTELKTIETAVNAAYDDALKQYLSAGDDLRSAEKRALDYSQKFMNMKMDAFHMKYPDSDLGRYIGATAHTANKYLPAVGGGGGRKKRTTRKKK
jgi:hypothetical protein